MPQDRESGARGNAAGRDRAREIAKRIGAKIISPDSNEVEWQQERLVIKSIKYRGPAIGVSRRMLGHVRGIIAAIEEEKGLFRLYRVNPQAFLQFATPSRSRRPSARKVLMLSTRRVQEFGERFNELQL